ncbi:MAG: hypothetical protein H7338_06795 [Candidatus Sericytochromatia bacterium]|nr:hypothetical protein [Candidatus Sericytochromatia bacterium]
MRLRMGLGLVFSGLIMGGCQAGVGAGASTEPMVYTLTVADVAYPLSGALTFNGPNTGANLTLDQGDTGSNRMTLLLSRLLLGGPKLVAGAFTKNDLVFTPQLIAGGRTLRVDRENAVLTLTSVTGSLSGTYTGSASLFDSASQTYTPTGASVPFAVRFSVPWGRLQRAYVQP